MPLAIPTNVIHGSISGEEMSYLVSHCLVRYHENLKQAGLERKNLLHPGRLFKMAVQQGRSERGGEAYCFCTSSFGAMRERR
jgi:hypothetical protein